MKINLICLWYKLHSHPQCYCQSNPKLKILHFKSVIWLEWNGGRGRRLIPSQVVISQRISIIFTSFLSCVKWKAHHHNYRINDNVDVESMTISINTNPSGLWNSNSNFNPSISSFFFKHFSSSNYWNSVQKSAHLPITWSNHNKQQPANNDIMIAESWDVLIRWVLFNEKYIYALYEIQ